MVNIGRKFFLSIDELKWFNLFLFFERKYVVKVNGGVEILLVVISIEIVGGKVF